MNSCHVVDNRTDTGAGHEAEDHGVSAAAGDERGDEPGEPGPGALGLVQLVVGHVLSSLWEIIDAWGSEFESMDCRTPLVARQFKCVQRKTRELAGGRSQIHESQLA
jgi:hypothetical protein